MCIGNILPALELRPTLLSIAVSFDGTGLTGNTGVSLFSKMSEIKTQHNLWYYKCTHCYCQNLDTIQNTQQSNFEPALQFCKIYWYEYDILLSIWNNVHEWNSKVITKTPAIQQDMKISTENYITCYTQSWLTPIILLWMKNILESSSAAVECNVLEFAESALGTNPASRLDKSSDSLLGFAVCVDNRPSKSDNATITTNQLSNLRQFWVRQRAEK